MVTHTSLSKNFGTVIVMLLLFLDIQNTQAQTPSNDIFNTYQRLGTWNFDDQDSSNARDRSGNNNNGVVHNATITNGICGNGMLFNGWGADQYVEVPHPTNWNLDKSFTLSLWFHAKQEGGFYGHSLIQYATGNTTRDSSQLNLKGFFIQIDSASNIDIGGMNTEIGISNSGFDKWHQLVVVVNQESQVAQSYLDGQLQKEDTLKPNFSFANNGNVLIGKQFYGTSAMKGTIDEINVYKNALTANDILQSYNLEKDGNCQVEIATAQPVPISNGGGGGGDNKIENPSIPLEQTEISFTKSKLNQLQQQIELEWEWTQGTKPNNYAVSYRNFNTNDGYERTRGNNETILEANQTHFTITKALPYNRYDITLEARDEYNNTIAQQSTTVTVKLNLVNRPTYPPQLISPKQETTIDPQKDTVLQWKKGQSRYPIFENYQICFVQPGKKTDGSSPYLCLSKGYRNQEETSIKITPIDWEAVKEQVASNSKDTYKVDIIISSVHSKGFLFDDGEYLYADPVPMHIKGSNNTLAKPTNIVQNTSPSKNTTINRNDTITFTWSGPETYRNMNIIQYNTCFKTTETLYPKCASTSKRKTYSFYNKQSWKWLERELLEETFNNSHSNEINVEWFLQAIYKGENITITLESKPWNLNITDPNKDWAIAKEGPATPFQKAPASIIDIPHQTTPEVIPKIVEETVIPEPPAGFERQVRTAEILNNPFPDTDMKKIGGKAAAYLYQKAIIGGFPDGEFKGSRLVNRAEAAKFLLRAKYGEINNQPNNGQFPDVLENEWYTKYVMEAARRGIIKGRNDGLFHPIENVNTAEFLKMMALTFNIPPNLPHRFKDIPENAWYSPYVGIAQKYNLFPQKRFLLEPVSPLSREDISIAIYQYVTTTPQISSAIQKQDLVLYSATPSGDTQPDLFIANTDGSNAKALTTTPNIAEENAVLSPNNSKVLFTKNKQLWILDRNTNTEFLLTNDGIDGYTNAYGYAWVNNQTVAVNRRKDYYDYRIDLYNIRTKHFETVFTSHNCTNCKAEYVIRDAFTTKEELIISGTENVWQPQMDIYALSLDETKHIRNVYVDSNNNHGDHSNARLNDTETMIAWTHSGKAGWPEGNQQILIKNVNDNGLERVLMGTEDDKYSVVDWSTDGTKIYLSYKGKLMSINANGNTNLQHHMQLPTGNYYEILSE